MSWDCSQRDFLDLKKIEKLGSDGRGRGDGGGGGEDVKGGNFGLRDEALIHSAVKQGIEGRCL